MIRVQYAVNRHAFSAPYPSLLIIEPDLIIPAGEPLILLCRDKGFSCEWINSCHVKINFT